MTHSPISYVSNRVLKLNVGFLLSSGPAHSHDSALDLPVVRVSDDLMLKYIRGPLRLSRTKEGLLVQARLQAAVDSECFRCLDPIEQDITVDLEELYTFHFNATTEFRINDDGILDLAPLLRAEVLISLSQRALCRPDCAGLCPECGVNWNHETCTCNLDNIDPRLAKLQKLLDVN